jgi:arylsulfatase A-like enzyme
MMPPIRLADFSNEGVTQYKRKLMMFSRQQHPLNFMKGVAAALSLVPGVALHATPEPVAPKPNIVLLLADDLGYGDVGCYGATRVRTPNIDRLRAQGVRFTDAHAPAAVCQPTRYGILAGRYYWRTTAKANNYYFHANEILLPKVLKDGGYRTAAFGKWHIGWGSEGGASDAEWFNREDLNPGPNTAGFDYFFGMPNTHEHSPQVYIENNRVYKRDPADPLRTDVQKDPIWKYAGSTRRSAGAKAAHEACDLNTLDLEMGKRAAAWIADQTKEKTFFLYVPFFAPHVPLLPNGTFAGTSRAGVQGDFIQQMDRGVGMILTALKEHGFEEDTLVVFTSDNGGVYIQEAMDKGHRSMGELLGLKGDAWEGGHRVPFLARWPGRIPAGADCDELLSLTDLYATFAAAAGVVLPQNAAPDSVNQLPLFEHPLDTPAIRTEMVYMGRGAGLRAGDWVYYPAQGPQGLFGTFYMTQLGFKNSDYEGNDLRQDAQPAQLYNVKEDISQAVNRYTRYPRIAAQMKARLSEILRQKRSR